MADKEYYIEKDNGDMIIAIPEEWKITFGPAFIAKKETIRTYNNGGIPWALRLYEGTAQRAVIMNVQSFRDMSIKVATKKVTAIAGKGIKQDWTANVPNREAFADIEDAMGVDWAAINEDIDRQMEEAMAGAIVPPNPPERLIEAGPGRRRRR